MRRWYLWVGGIVLFFAIWWNQPYFGWNYCVGKGWMSDEDFLEELRPNLLGPDSQSPSADKARHIVNEAIDLMKECIAQRGLEYCQYAGPDTDGPIAGQRINRPEPYGKYKYRYIKNSSNVGISILPIEDAEVTHISFYTYDFSIFKGSSIDENGLYNRTGFKEIGFSAVCILGCSCNKNFRG
ncbi:hypothetical protein [Roseibium sediminis]|uniref:hypothetical protein n=1 Tax=Roseibium sediminis TaxID=1775174 RepID=UPI00123C8374|nr:hypothetical protein [Roseibium sediminis]